MSAYKDAQANNDITRNVKQYRDLDLFFGRKTNDDLNKDRVLGMLESSDDEDEIDMGELYASMRNSQDEPRVEEISE